jgi:hypothetical protein
LSAAIKLSLIQVGQTRVVQDDHDPVWDQTFTIPLYNVPDDEDGVGSVKLVIRDHDPDGIGDFIGEAILHGAATGENSLFRLEADKEMELPLKKLTTLGPIKAQGSLGLQLERKGETGSVHALELTVKDAEGLASADAGGKSDPYVSVYFNGVKVCVCFSLLVHARAQHSTALLGSTSSNHY